MHEVRGSKPGSGGPPTLGDGGPGLWLLLPKLGPFITTKFLLFSLKRRVADGLRGSSAKGEAPKSAEPRSATASQGLVGYKTPRRISDCHGTE